MLRRVAHLCLALVLLAAAAGSRPAAAGVDPDRPPADLEPIMRPAASTLAEPPGVAAAAAAAPGPAPAVPAPASLAGRDAAVAPAAVGPAPAAAAAGTPEAGSRPPVARTDGAVPEGGREAGPDPAGALAELPTSRFPSPMPPAPAPAAGGPEWGLTSSPERDEVDIDALPDAPLPRLDPSFPVPGQLRTRVDFWKFVYAGVGTYELVIHDTRYMDKIYEVVAMPVRPVDWKAYLRVRRATLERARAKYRAILVRLATAAPKTRLSDEEERVRALLADLPGGPAKYREAARRIHGQAGMRDRFVEALEVSEAYLPEMERIFRERNLPIELTRLPFVESGFNPHASSKARAVGVWQFIKPTARRFGLVTRRTDLRRDVTASTIAAAKLLSYNYRETGSWPLALMAYHHGLAGIKRAVRVTGTTDVDTIVRTYNGRRFKYASRNYYAQFVAVNELLAAIKEAEATARPAEEVLAGITPPAGAVAPVAATGMDASAR